MRGIGPDTNVGIGLRDNAGIPVFMIALWMLGATAVPIDFRVNAAERSLLAKEFDLVAIIEDRQLSGAGYYHLLIDQSWVVSVIAEARRRPDLRE